MANDDEWALFQQRMTEQLAGNQPNPYVEGTGAMKERQAEAMPSAGQEGQAGTSPDMSQPAPEQPPAASMKEEPVNPALADDDTYNKWFDEQSKERDKQMKAGIDPRLAGALDYAKGFDNGESGALKAIDASGPGILPESFLRRMETDPALNPGGMIFGKNSLLTGVVPGFGMKTEEASKADREAEILDARQKLDIAKTLVVPGIGLQNPAIKAQRKRMGEQNFDRMQRMRVEALTKKLQDLESEPLETQGLITSWYNGFSSSFVGGATGAAKLPFIAWEMLGGLQQTSGGRRVIQELEADIQRIIPLDPGRQEDFNQMLASGAGSMSSMLIGGMVLKGLGYSQMVAAMGPGVAMQVAPMLEDAERYNASTAQKYFTILGAIGLGATEAVQINSFLGALERASGGSISSALLKRSAVEVIGREAAKEMLEEAIQEGFQTAGEDFIASYFGPGFEGYDPERFNLGTLTKALKAAAVGGILGAAAGGTAGAAEAANLWAYQNDPGLLQARVQNQLQTLITDVEAGKLGDRAEQIAYLKQQAGVALEGDVLPDTTGPSVVEQMEADGFILDLPAPQIQQNAEAIASGQAATGIQLQPEAVRKHTVWGEGQYKKPVQGTVLKNKGRIVLQAEGKPDFVIGDGITPQDFLGFTEAVATSPDEIVAWSKWYDEVFGVFRKNFGEGNDAIADVAATAWLSAQQGISVGGAMREVLMQAEQSARQVAEENRQIGGRFRNAAEVVRKILEGIPAENGGNLKIMDFLDSGTGSQTRSYYGGDGRFGMPFTIDRHSARATGAVDGALLNTLRRNGYNVPEGVDLDFGRGKTDDADSSIPGPLYENRARFGREVADYANKTGWLGKSDWTPAQIQAANWMAMLKWQGQTPADTNTAFSENRARVSFEVEPSIGTPEYAGLFQRMKNMPQEVQGKVQQDIATFVWEEADRLAGLLQSKPVFGNGGWKTFTTPYATVGETLATREGAQRAALLAGYATEQEAVWSNRTKPVWTQKPQAAAIDIMGQDADTLFQEVRRTGPVYPEKSMAMIEGEEVDLAGEPIIEGFQPITQNGMPGIRIIVEQGALLNKAQAVRNILAVKEWVEQNQQTLAERGVSMTASEAVVDIFENNWKDQPDGKAYREKIRELFAEDASDSTGSGRAAVELADRLRQATRQRLEERITEEEAGTGISDIAPRRGAHQAGSQPELTQDGKIELSHWSTSAIDVLDPVVATSMSNARWSPQTEWVGDRHWTDRVYYGVNAASSATMPKDVLRFRQKMIDRGERLDTLPYLNEKGNYRHVVRLNPGDLYNWSEDPMGYRAKVTRGTGLAGVYEMESLIKEGGWKGIYYPRSPLGQVAIMFNPATSEGIVKEEKGGRSKWVKPLPAGTPLPMNYDGPPPEGWTPYAGEDIRDLPQPVKTETPEFKNFYGNSALVDPYTGQPVMMYHGTKSDIAKFEKEKIRPNDYDFDFNGFWFSSDPNTGPAFQFPDVTMPVWVSIQNPAPWDTVLDVMRDVERDIYTKGFDAAIREGARSDGDEARMRLQEMGFDGTFSQKPYVVDREAFERTGRYDGVDARGNKWWIERGQVAEQSMQDVTWGMPVVRITNSVNGQTLEYNNLDRVIDMMTIMAPQAGIDLAAVGPAFKAGFDFMQSGAVDLGEFDISAPPQAITIPGPNGASWVVEYAYNEQVGQEPRPTGNMIDTIDYYEEGIGYVTGYTDLNDFIRMNSEWTAVAFEPTQIKSAIGNSGAFDPANPDISAVQPMGPDNPYSFGTTNLPGAVNRGSVPQGDPNVDQTSKVTDRTIVRAIVDAFDLTLRQGLRHRGHTDALGYFNGKTRVIRARDTGDWQMLAHEAGHAIMELMETEAQSGNPNAFQQFADQWQDRLREIALATYGTDLTDSPKRIQLMEGFAEFFRLYVTNPGYFMNNEKGFVVPMQMQRDFATVLSPEMNQSVDNIQKMIETYKGLSDVQFARNMVVSPRRIGKIEGIMNDVSERGLVPAARAYGTLMMSKIHNFYTRSLNDTHDMYRLVAALQNVAQGVRGKPIDMKTRNNPGDLATLLGNTPQIALKEAKYGIFDDANRDVILSPGLTDALGIMMGERNFMGQKRVKWDEKAYVDLSTYLTYVQAKFRFKQYNEKKIPNMPLGPQVTEGAINQVIAQLEAQYGDRVTLAAEAVWKYAQELLRKRARKHGLPKDLVEEMIAENPNYVPLMRDVTDKNSVLPKGFAKSIQRMDELIRLKGSSRQVYDPIASLMMMTYNTEQQIAMNDIKRAVVNAAKVAGNGAGRYVEWDPNVVKSVSTTVKFEELRDQLEASMDGITRQEATDLMLMLDSAIDQEETFKLWKQAEATPNGERLVFYWEDGKKKAFILGDDDISDGVFQWFLGTSATELPPFWDVMTTMSNTVRQSITTHPNFIIKNFLRDQWEVWTKSDVGYIPFYHGLKGVMSELRQDEVAHRAARYGMIFGGAGTAQLHDSQVQQDVRALQSRGYAVEIFGGTEGTFKNALKGLQHFSELTETGTRLGLFDLAYKRALRDGLSPDEAGFEAAHYATDVMNFGRHGKNTGLLRRAIPFLSAQLNGLDKQIRQMFGDDVALRKGVLGAIQHAVDPRMMDDPTLSRTEKIRIRQMRAIWMKMTALATFSVAMLAAYRDDEDFQERSRYLSATGWLIPNPNVEGGLIWIPKPHEIAILANMVEAGYDYMDSKNSGSGKQLLDQLIPPLVPPGFLIPWEAMNNIDTFTGRQISPLYMQRFKPKDRYNEYTSETAKAIGGVMNWDPFLIDHVLSAFGTEAARDANTLIDQGVRDYGRDMDIADTPILRTYFRKRDRGSRLTSDFWDQASGMSGKLEQAKNGYKRLVDAGANDSAAMYLDGLTDDEKAFAILGTHFDTEAARLHPLRRARDAAGVIRQIRQELKSPNGLTLTDGREDEFVQLPKDFVGEIDDILSDLQRRTIRNAMVAVELDGWGNKSQVDSSTSFEMLSRLDRRVAEELTRRWKTPTGKTKIYNEQVVNKNWLELKAVLLENGPTAELDDFVSAAERAGDDWEAPE